MKIFDVLRCVESQTHCFSRDIFSTLHCELKGEMIYFANECKTFKFNKNFQNGIYNMYLFHFSGKWTK